MKRSRLLVPLVSLMLLLVAAPGVANAPGPPQGAWTYAGGEKEIAAMEKSVDEIVDEMNLFIRPIARARLPKICSPWEKLAIEKKGDRVRIRNERRDFTLPIGKTVNREGSDGPLKATLKYEDGVLKETLAGEDGSRVNEFHPIAGGVRVESSIHSDRLPKPVRFSYSYR